MAHWTTEEDHKRDEFLLVLLLKITATGESFTEEKVARILPFYLFFLRINGLKDLGFYRDIVNGNYPELHAGLVALVGFGIFAVDNRGVFHTLVTYRQIQQLLEVRLLTPEERFAAHESAKQVAPLYMDSITFDEAVAETHYFHQFQ